MKKLLLALGLVLSFSSNAWSAISEADRSLQTFRNLLTNPGAELGKAGWTVSTGSFAASTSSPLEGGASFTWDAGAASETFTSTAVAIPEGWKGHNGAVSCKIQCASGTCTHTLTAFDGTNNLINPITITSSTSGAPRTSANFVFPSSGSVSVRLTSAANEPSAKIDSCVLSLAEGFNAMNVSQASLVGTAFYPITASCNWARTSATLGAPSTTAACPGPTIETNVGPGIIQTTDNDLPQFTVNSLPPGTYWVSFDGTAFIGTSAQEGAFAINDGTTTFGQTGHQWAVAGSHFHVEGAVTYTATANQTFKLFWSSAANAATVSASSTNENLHFTIMRFPTVTELAYRAEQLNWKVDFNVTGTNISLGTANQASYIEMTGAALTGVNNTSSGNNVLTAQIACATGNPSVGLTCTGGTTTESNGIAFTLPVAGDIEVCVDYSHELDVGASATAGSLDSTFEIIETTNTSSAIVNEGKDRKDSYLEMVAAGGNREIVSHPIHTCGTFNESSPGQKTFRLEYEQLVSGTITASNIYTDASAARGQRDVHWTVRPLSYVTPPFITTNPYTARYTLNANQSITSATLTVVAWDTMTYDGKSMCSGLGTTGFVCTIPFAGKYRVSASLFTVAAVWTAGQAIDLYIYKNGSAYTTITNPAWSATSNNIWGEISDTVTAVAGDTINIRFDQNRGSATNIAGASDGRGYFAIERIGD